MEGIKKFFFSSTKTGKEIKMTFDNRAFSLKRIKVLSCDSFSDCSYIETILFTFYLCDERTPHPINGTDIDIQFRAGDQYRVFTRTFSSKRSNEAPISL